MPRDVEPSLNEREFILSALREDIRMDGRAFDAYRDLKLEFGDEYGVADVRLGKTRLVWSTYISNRIWLGLFLTEEEQSCSTDISRSHDSIPRSQVRWHLPDIL